MTGGRIDERGELQLRGRVDDAVKIRGYLVEPMEVEAHIRRIPGVADVFVAVVLEKRSTGDRRLRGPDQRP